jgi:hypothetical protein
VVWIGFFKVLDMAVWFGSVKKIGGLAWLNRNSCGLDGLTENIGGRFFPSKRITSRSGYMTFTVFLQVKL